MESFDASFKKNLDESPKRFKTTHKTKKTKNQNGRYPVVAGTFIPNRVVQGSSTKGEIVTGELFNLFFRKNLSLPLKIFSSFP